MIAVPCLTRSGSPRLALRVVAGDPAALAAGLACGADALVLEGPLPPGLAARLRAREGNVALYAALDGPEDPGLAAILREAPDALLLRGARSGRDVVALGARLAVHEAESGLPDGGTAILAEISESLGALDARSFVGASPRLAGLGLDGAALAAALGGEGSGLTQARGLIRLAAAAAGVTAFEALGRSGSEEAAVALRDGFGLLLVREPAQVAAIRTALLETAYSIGRKIVPDSML